MVQIPSAPCTVGASSFSPDQLFEDWAAGHIRVPQNDDLFSAVRKAFNLKEDDSYVYHAVASVTLSQVQSAINHGANQGLHAWYLDEMGRQLPAPSVADIDAYTAIFASTTSTSKALTTFEKNAKKQSIRSAVAKNLLANRLWPQSITIPKLKTAHVNPYLDFWSWSCRNLEWAGPDANTVNVKQSHHILPVFYHHFGCICPSFESLETIRQLAAGRAIIEVGSGNGYWTYLLRRLGLSVQAVDNQASIWRTMWIGDTVSADGARYLAREKGAKEAVLLLVYPQVTTEFTTSMLKAYKGSMICIAGTQNANGFTAFSNMTIDTYMDAEMSNFAKIVQIPLPSFAGKDEALFVFERRE